MKKCTLCGVVILIVLMLISSCQSTEKHEVKSPDGSLCFKVKQSEESGSWLYQVTWNGKTLVSSSLLGFTLVSGEVIPAGYHVKSVEYKVIDEIWKPVYGEQENYRDHANELLINFSKDQSGEKNFGIRIRAYNEGVAFRYEFYAVEEVKIEKELTTFSLDENAKVWVSEKAQSAIFKTSIGALKTDKEYERPLLVECNDSVFLALGEAGLENFSRMKFSTDASEKGVLHASLSSGNDGRCTAVLDSLNNCTPWRYIMAGHNASEILQHNFLLLNLNKPNQLKDISWIKPGKVLREVTLTTKGAKACIDFAKRNNLQYVLFDAGWYGPENDAKSDATTVTVDPDRSKGPLDMPFVLNYAKENGIGIILYVNHKAIEQQESEIFPLYRSWGIKGIKYGFVNVGSQYWTKWMHHSIKHAAEYQLMVDVHDEYRPTGLSRTYPHLMTQEGIRGDEESPTNEMVINTVFTRMIAGAGDHTNCYHADRVEAKMGSRVSQMAKMICIYSPWQFVYWYDRPANSPSKVGGAGKTESYIIENRESDFYKEIPTTWNESRIVEGYPGKYVLIERRNGDTWYIGGLTGTDEKIFEVPLDFLSPDVKYKATIYSDTLLVKDNRKEVKIEERIVSSSDKFLQKVHPMNGFAIIIKPEQ